MPSWECFKCFMMYKSAELNWHNENEKVIQFFSFSRIVWKDIGTFFFNLFHFILTALTGCKAGVHRF
jgi:hypothetical protein